uniref:Artemin n=1 Tax=Sphaeramia orbicularis TaxID=375764 RepID=A0A672YZQ8_9TELE
EMTTSTLKLILILFCLQTGRGRRLRPLTGEGVKGPSAVVVPLRHRRSTPDSQCGLRSVLLQVRDLGLGYDSDESVLFKYCGGTCPRARSNHDLTLSNLLLSGVLPAPAPGELWHHAPCCRPTHHEDMAFLDNSHRWHKVEQLSASACSCVG